MDSWNTKWINRNSIHDIHKCVITAYLYDLASMEYIGCDNNEQHIRLINLFAIQGKTQGWYESWEYKNRNDQQLIAKAMKEIHDYTLTGNQILGNVLSDYWENDKCKFSKLYQMFKDEMLFERLYDLAGPQLPKIKRFECNINLPGTNMFFGSGLLSQL